MDLELMKNYCSHLSGFSNLDISIYENDVLIDTFAAVGDPFELKTRLIKQLENKSFFILNCEAEIAIAKIPVDNTPYTIYIGPCLTIQKDNRTTQKILNFFELPSTLYQELDSYLFSLPTYKFYSLIGLAISTSEAINHTSPNLIDAFSLDLSDMPNVSQSQKISRKDMLSFSARERSYQFEEKLRFLISNGLTEELSNADQFIDLASTASKIANGTLRQLQNCIEVLITISSRAAMAGGLPPIIAYDLSDIYYMKAENARSIEEIYSSTSNVPLVFASKVKEFKSFKTNNYIVKKCVNYIYANIFNKISLEDIASAIGASPTYVSSQFSKEFNMTIPHFIKTCRIHYAEYYLKFSNYSLVEIANLLNFSSQSAFQNAFKDIVGMTPMEYKTSNSL